MKNYKVVATRYFKDSNEIDEKTGLKKERQANDEFFCTKERYEFLKENNAVKLVEIVEEEKKITEEEVQAVANAIVEEAVEQEKSIEEIVNEIVDEAVEEAVDEVVEEIISKKKKRSKK